MSSMRDPIFGCELVTSKLDKDGYAFSGRTRAHIAAWERENGVVPDGMEIEHRCRRRNCVAMHHLRLVTRSENEKLKSLKNRLRVPCDKGHLIQVNRAITPEGGITCRACNMEAIRK